MRLGVTYISGMGAHHPDRRVTNFDLMEHMETTNEWILEHTGIVERRRAPEDMRTSDLGARSTSTALDQAGWDPASLELLVCATSTPDKLMPSVACFIAEKLGLPSVAFDVGAACSGGLYALSVAHGLMSSHGYARGAVCAAEKYSAFIDPADRANSIFFGDSAATLLLQTERPAVGFELIDVDLENRNEGADLVNTPHGGHFNMQGNVVKEIATAGQFNSASRMLARHGYAASDLRAFMSHQANLRLVEKLAEMLGVEPDRHWRNADMFGNQGASGVLTSFLAGVDENADDLRDGDLFLLTTYGAGFTSASALLRRVDRRKAEPAQ